MFNTITIALTFARTVLFDSKLRRQLVDYVRLARDFAAKCGIPFHKILGSQELTLEQVRAIRQNEAMFLRLVDEMFAVYETYLRVKHTPPEEISAFLSCLDSTKRFAKILVRELERHMKNGCDYNSAYRLATNALFFDEKARIQAEDRPHAETLLEAVAGREACAEVLAAYGSANYLVVMARCHDNAPAPYILGVIDTNHHRCNSFYCRTLEDLEEVAEEQLPDLVVNSLSAQLDMQHIEERTRRRAAQDELDSLVTLPPLHSPARNTIQ